jgi:hypothetical protein
MNDDTRFNDASVGSALDLLSPGEVPSPTLAWTRQRALHAQPPQANPLTTSWRSLVSTLSRAFAVARRPIPALPIAAVVLFGLSFFTSPMQSLASQFLTIFRVQDFAPVTISSSAYGVPDLTRFGDMTPSTPPAMRPQHVNDLAAASAAVGFTVKGATALPAGIPAQPHDISVTSAQTVSFTFRAEKARAYLDSINRSDFSLPARFDGATVVVHVPAAAMLTYAPPDAVGAPEEVNRRALADTAMRSIVLVQAKSPTVEASGVSFEELRDFMLSLPGLPPETAAQIRAIGNLGTTLPVPVPPEASARKIQVNGAPGLIYAERNSSLAGGIVWQRDGIVYATGGALNEAELTSIASSVR